MPEKEELEVPERICYTPTRKTERPPISENLTSITPCAAANHNILEVGTVLNSHGTGEQLLTILCLKLKK